MNARRVALASIALLAGCGGSQIAGTVTAPGQPSASAKRQTVTITVAVPNRVAAGSRRPAYVSASTRSIGVVVTSPGAPPAPAAIANCATACSESVSVAPGSATFDVSLYDDIFGRGDVLSQGSATATIVAGANNAVNLTFDPVVARFVLTVPDGGYDPNPQLVIGTPSTLPNVFFALDAAGNTLAGPGRFVDASGTPVTFAFTNTGDGHATLSASSLSAPGTLSITYDGHGIVGTLSVTSSQGQTSSRYTSVLPPEQQNATHTLYPHALATGADGNVWFTQYDVAHAISRRNADGSIASFAIPPATSGGSLGEGLVLAGDGALWFNDLGAFYSVTTAGAITMHPLPQELTYYGITGLARDPGGGVAFSTFDDKFGRIALDGTVTIIPGATQANNGVASLILGPDNRLWFIDGSDSATPTLVAYGNGTFSRYPMPLPSARIVTGPDGTIWAPFSGGTSLVRYSTSGAVVSTTAIAVAGSQGSSFDYGYGIVSGMSDGAHYVYYASSNAIGRLDAAGNATAYPLYYPSLYPNSPLVVGSQLYWLSTPVTGADGQQGGGLGSVDTSLL